jgi:hypothetical protein
MVKTYMVLKAYPDIEKLDGWGGNASKGKFSDILRKTKQCIAKPRSLRLKAKGVKPYPGITWKSRLRNALRGGMTKHREKGKYALVQLPDGTYVRCYLMVEHLARMFEEQSNARGDVVFCMVCGLGHKCTVSKPIPASIVVDHGREALLGGEMGGVRNWVCHTHVGTMFCNARLLPGYDSLTRIHKMKNLDIGAGFKFVKKAADGAIVRPNRPPAGGTLKKPAPWHLRNTLSATIEYTFHSNGEGNIEAPLTYGQPRAGSSGGLADTWIKKK